ncbi:hypothetical protein OIO90_000370 [Microbotryomycetes sp. JL221]|nr:hypothetical protein OIO90_000370 [Microbotryomycetes sp. JL221]
MVTVLKKREPFIEHEAEQDDEFECLETSNRDPPHLDGRQSLSLPWAELPRLVDIHGKFVVTASGTTLHVTNTDSPHPDNKFLNWSVLDSITMIRLSEDGQSVWVGTETGELLQVDVSTVKLTERRTDGHHAPIKLIQRRASLRSASTRYDLPPKPGFCQLLNDQLWMLYAREHPTSLQIICRLLVIQLKSSPTIAPDGSPEEVEPIVDEEWMHGWRGKNTFGIVTSMAVLPSYTPKYIFVGHAQDRTLDNLGQARGQIYVYDAVRPKDGQLRLLKHWQAHEKNSPIATLGVDTSTLWTGTELCVYSNATDHKLHFWDGLLSHDWQTRTLDSRTATFSTSTDLRLAHMTFNVGATLPSKLEVLSKEKGVDLLADFLRPLQGYDVISFGLQEVVDLENLNLALELALFATPDHPMTDRYRKWKKVLKEAVSKHLGDNYVRLFDDKLIGLYSCVFIKRQVKARLKDVAHVTQKTGFENEWGNKGAIHLRFVLDDTSIVIVNNHLAAGEGALNKRRRDVKTILDNVKFPVPSVASRFAFVAGGNGTCVSDHEVVIFAGDLNFRINMTREDVLAKLNDQQSINQTLAELVACDELTREMHDEPPFQQNRFAEQKLTFRPTYKYNVDSQTFDTSVKQRVPSWCDRILYRCDQPNGVIGTGYRSHQDVTISDHRPVSATFTIKIKTVDPKRYAAEKAEVAHDWLSMRNSLVSLAKALYSDDDDDKSDSEEEGYQSNI